ncbi:hypothetical protein [Jatrophihabitans endophyticus]|uniref:hypothetical protein n=1 Tax=Jatrophihabitans endophyticus TaxID=1206085 RepID=UPI0019EB4C1F|nr:hypothetical protein [Jatrophihabitans endophyticus]MBE7187532.1 hypothetical protein [Jatrophihabitans endophyticus]
MAGTTPRLPEQFRTEHNHDDFQVSELVSEAAGAHSPFGDTQFPLPYTALNYEHPTPDGRPNQPEIPGSPAEH